LQQVNNSQLTKTATSHWAESFNRVIDREISWASIVQHFAASYAELRWSKQKHTMFRRMLVDKLPGMKKDFTESSSASTENAH